MLRHFVLSIFRNILKDKASTLINLINLTTGFAAFILLSMVVNYEFSYDKFNENYGRIYRVQTKQEDSYPINFCTFSPPAYRYRLLNDLPEVEQVLLMREISGKFFSLPDGGQLYERYGYYSENSIFDIFTIKLIEGSKNNALSAPNTIALSETVAHKLFPNGGAVGDQVLMGKRHPFIVTAVYADFPQNATMRPSYLISMSGYEQVTSIKDFRDDWTYIEFDNYVLLKKNTSPELVDAKIRNAFESVKNYEKSSPYLHPLSKHHISSNNQPDLLIGLSVLSLAALLVLTLSCVNYVNLALANSTRRACEIGIKKVVGFSKKAIATQFLAETMLLAFFAMVLGLLVAQDAAFLMNRILQKNIDFIIFENQQLMTIIILAGSLAGILSGLYPAIVLSGYNPVKVLKGKVFSRSGSSVNLRKILVTTQFGISLFMLTVSFILYRHVNFILNKDLGFDSKNTLYTEINIGEKIDYETLRERLLHHPNILEASISNTIPFLGNIGGYVHWEDAAPDQKEMISRNYVSYDFIPTYNLNIVAGRNFSREYPADKKSCIINETALKVFGWDDPIGKKIFLLDKSYQVIGVVKDFHAFSVHNTIPTYIMFLKENLGTSQLLTVRSLPGSKMNAREAATQELEAIIPNDSFEFKDLSLNLELDGAINFWQSMKRLFIFFAIVSLIISSMGLFGLMLFTTKRRTKEIGIRKVLGSSVGGIYRQLSYEVVGLLGFAALFAFPAAGLIYDTMPGAYKEKLSVSEFLLATSLVAVVAFVTISYHVIKVALSNPVEALRYEEDGHRMQCPSDDVNRRDIACNVHYRSVSHKLNNNVI